MKKFTNSLLATLRRFITSRINGGGRQPSSRRITKITIHHAAGVINGQNLLNWGHDPRCTASWQYGIGNDGVNGQLVEERHRAWTSSSAANDWDAVTIEVGNSTAGSALPPRRWGSTSTKPEKVKVTKRYQKPCLKTFRYIQMLKAQGLWPDDE